MATNAITKETIFDGQRKHVVRVNILSTGTAPITATDAGNPIVDVSALTPAPTSVSIEKIEGTGPEFPMSLQWDATTDVNAFHLGVGDTDLDFKCTGPINNPMSATGSTGDVHLTASNGVAAGERGSFVVTFVKRGL